MCEWARGKRHRLAHDSSESGMSVNGRSATVSDHEVLLPWSRFDQNNVAADHAVACSDKTGLIGELKPSRRISIAQPISFGNLRNSSKRQQACVHQADAIEAQNGVPPMQPEGLADEAGGSIS